MSRSKRALHDHWTKPQLVSVSTKLKVIEREIFALSLLIFFVFVSFVPNFYELLVNPDKRNQKSKKLTLPNVF